MLSAAESYEYTPEIDETEVIVKHFSCEMVKNHIHHLLLVGVDLKDQDICAYLSWNRFLPHEEFVGECNVQEKLGFEKPFTFLNSEVRVFCHIHYK